MGKCVWYSGRRLYWGGFAGIFTGQMHGENDYQIQKIIYFQNVHVISKHSKPPCSGRMPRVLLNGIRYVWAPDILIYNFW